MSRVGKYPVEIPAGVQVAIAGGMLTAKGKLGELKLALTEFVEASVDGNKISVKPVTNETRNRQILERIPAARWGEPRDIAGAAVFLSSSASNYITGEVLVVDGGWMSR